MKKKSQSYHLYRIDWIDATSDGGWKDHRQFKPEPIMIHSVGWLTHDMKNTLTLTQQMSSRGTGADRITIPKAWIKSKRKITKHLIKYDY